MADLAGRAQSTSIQIAPGEVQTYRLPTMSRGSFNIRATRQITPVTTGKPGATTGPGQPSPSPILKKVPDGNGIVSGAFRQVALGPQGGTQVAPPVTQPEQLGPHSRRHSSPERRRRISAAGDAIR